jgi:hypothetical protein
MNNDGGPAFPVLMKVGEIAQSDGGMSLRDYYLARMLPVTYQLRAADLGGFLKNIMSLSLKEEAKEHASINTEQAMELSFEMIKQITESDDFKRMAEQYADAAINDAVRIVDKMLAALSAGAQGAGDEN